MCGRRKYEKQVPGWKDQLGDMDMHLAGKIINQLEPGTVVQLHWNGEPTLYDELAWIGDLVHAKGCYACMDTNGLLLYDRIEDIDGHFDSVTVSIIPRDTLDNYDRQISQLENFMDNRSHARPIINLRVLGEIFTTDHWHWNIYKRIGKVAEVYGLNIVTRVLHSPDMSRDYEKPVTKPEIGVCLDLLTHPAIDRHGNVYTCVRFNPDGLNYLGNAGEHSLESILGSNRRHEMIRAHFEGRRNDVPLCAGCDFYGVPTGW